MYHKFLTPLNSLKTFNQYMKREITKFNISEQVDKSMLACEECINILENLVQILTVILLNALYLEYIGYSE